MKVVWRLYRAAPAGQCTDFVPCCPGRTVAAGIFGGKCLCSAPVGNPRDKSRLAAWLFAQWLFVWSGFRLTAAATSFDLALMGSQGGWNNVFSFTSEVGKKMKWSILNIRIPFSLCVFNIPLSIKRLQWEHHPGAKGTAQDQDTVVPVPKKMTV